MTRTVRILGTHGVPANYGGFETAAEHVATHLVSRGWRVVVYCQAEGRGPIREDTWQGIERVTIPVMADGWRGTSWFDLLSIRHASRFRDLCLTFGYNTAVFNTLQRVRGIPNVINMDGIEWSRARWGLIKQGILLANERYGCRVGDHLIADHPEIARYFRGKARADKISTITYGAHAVTDASDETPVALGLTPGRYFTLIARPIRENSILELVQGFSARPTGHQLAVLGQLEPDRDPYHRAVVEAAGEDVRFLGPIYQPDQVRALRFHSSGYLHGHTVGGTNPSLVEALGAGNAVLAHDNPYNRWVAAEAALYFRSPADVTAHLERLTSDPDAVARMRSAARSRHAEEFTWEHVAGQYEAVLLDLLARKRTNRNRRPVRSRRGIKQGSGRTQQGKSGTKQSMKVGQS